MTKQQQLFIFRVTMITTILCAIAFVIGFKPGIELAYAMGQKVFIHIFLIQNTLLFLLFPIMLLASILRLSWAFVIVPICFCVYLPYPFNQLFSSNTQDAYFTWHAILAAWSIVIIYFVVFTAILSDAFLRIRNIRRGKK